ncbi:hypothetical protein [Streptomyces coelicoflavus]|uniref:hypothetical protein n=1 Tax=Streptomyces coelicoflavus TaxID=285562 RepID=UPI0036A341D4
MGTWATDKVFAKCFGNEIRGFRLGGSEASETAWRRTLPGSLCAVTRHAGVDGRTAIAYAGNDTGGGAGADGRPDGDPLTRPCDRLAVFDMGRGLGGVRADRWQAAVGGQRPVGLRGRGLRRWP